MSDANYVPIEQRWFGLDKRGIPYAVVMVALIVLLVYVVPAVNDQIAWTDETKAGDQLDLGGGLTIAPPVGWLLQGGVRVSDDPVVPVSPETASAGLVNGGVSVEIATSGWDGTASELMDQQNKLRENSEEHDDKFFRVTGPRDTVTTSNGVTGVSETFTSATGDGKVFAFAVDVGGEPTGVVITVNASPESLAKYNDEIDEMVSSLSTGDAAP